MSSGVDSSLAAALLKKDGYDVIGVTMQLGLNSDRDISGLEHTCCMLNIPLHILNLATEFQSLVIDHFCREYSTGRTPNPCIICNQRLKFGLLLDRAKELDADFLATGHYARIEPSQNSYHLLKAVDKSKDQSYFLYTLTQRELRHLLFPIGDLSKAEVRKQAARLGLTTARRHESQDICFIPDNDYRTFIARHISLQSGDIVDTEGRVLGKHHGLALYTVGQRQGLGLASKERLYVLKLDAADNRLMVGTEDQLSSDRLCAENVGWVSGKAPPETNNITAKIRYRSPEVAVNLRLNNRTAEVDFEQPQRAVTPGQSIVFYQGNTVLGGGIIEEGEKKG